MAATTLAAGDQPPGFDPTVSIESPCEALSLADTIMDRADRVSDGGIWEALAVVPLAAVLYAASPQGNGKGMPWVLSAVQDIEPKQCQSPDWAQAAGCCHPYPGLGPALSRILEMDDRQRDSVAITMGQALKPWLHTAPQNRPTNVDNPTERN